MLTRMVRSLTLAAVAAGFAVSSAAQPVRVPGTKVTLAPPDGFSVARQYPGFERAEDRASIMVTELPVSAAAMARSMTAPALATKGMTLISASDPVIAGKPARLLHVRQQSPAGEVLKWILVAGDPKTTFMIVGTFTGGGPPGIGESIRLSLLTTSWGGAAAAPSPFEGLPFRMTPTATLKLARRVSNMLMFTESGTPGTPGATEALYIAGHSIGQGHIGDLRAFSETRARQTTAARGVTNFSGRTLLLEGLDAYELEADASDARSGRAMRLYQVIIPDQTGYFILQGFIRADRAAEIVPEFKALTARFRLHP
jgi:hypothetical protein